MLIWSSVNLGRSDEVMDCTAILVNYYGADDTLKAVATLRDDCATLDVTVVDNSASDVEFSRLTHLLPSDVCLLKAQQNLGFGGGCNWAFAATTARYVLLVNPDVRVTNGCIASLYSRLDEDEKIGAVAPRQFLDDACQWQLPPSWFPTHLRAWATETAIRDRRQAIRLSRALRAEAVRYWTATRPVAQRALSGGVVMVRRTAIESDATLFDPRFFMYFEDSDLCRRLKRRGYRLEAIPNGRAVHQWRNLPHKSEMMARGATLYFDKYAEGQVHWDEKSRLARMAAVLRPLLRKSCHFPKSGFVVPAQWENGWVLELSPSPLLSPAIGRIGVGHTVEYPNAVLPNFAGVPVYGRLGPLTQGGIHDDCVYFEFNAGASDGEICDF